MSRTLLGKRILIVEDNSANRVVYTVALMGAGAVVLFDRWGKDTVNRLPGYRPDLIVLDLMLPHGDSGYEIFEKIRAKSEYASIPIVAISASDPSVAVPKCRKMGFDGFIAKPIEDDVLGEHLLQIPNRSPKYHTS